MAGPLIGIQELSRFMTGPDTAIIDATWHMPGSGRTGRQDYARGHISGAVFLDIDAVSDHNTPLPHMLPDAQAFAAAMGALGIRPTTQVIVYDQHGLFSAPRVWWMLRAFGHSRVFVLDGGLPAWVASGGSVTTDMPHITPCVYAVPETAPHRLADIHAVRHALAHEWAVADARSPSRFSGTEADPRPGVRSGHMPGSHNVHYKTLLAEDGIHLKPPSGLQRAFADAGVDPQRPVITTCGSGITACILALGLEVLGNSQWSVYDGSWAEWGSRSDTDVRSL